MRDEETVKRIPTLLVIVALLALAGGAYAALAASGGASGGGAPQRKAAARRTRLTAHGHIRGLYPGAARKMRTTVRNRAGRGIRVKWIKTRIRSASASCAAGNLVAKRKHLRVPRIGAHGVRRLGIRIRLRGTAPNACQQARWPLRFKIKARVRGGHR
jgi:hypothetical protein